MICRTCGIDKSEDEFYVQAPRRNRRAHRRRHCKDCVRIQVARHRDGLTPAERARRVRSTYLKATYGLTLSEYERLVELQESRCAICGATEPGGTGAWHIDHNHESGDLRGLLCFLCNSRLAIVENVDWMTRAKSYLAEPPWRDFEDHVREQRVLDV